MENGPLRRGLRNAVVLAVTGGCLMAGMTATAGARGLSARAADLAAARNQWVSAQTLSGGAGQAIPLVLVVADLRRAIAAGADRGTYSHIIGTVVTFGQLPDAMLTPAEVKQFNLDFAAIDRFFGFRKSPWDSSGCLTHAAEARAAARAWSEEPKGVDAGVSASPLKAAVSDLQRGLKRDTGDRSCYPAAIEDLKSLETATAAQIRARPNLNARAFEQPGSVDIVWSEIAWLNNWLSFVNDDDPGATPVLTA